MVGSLAALASCAVGAGLVTAAATGADPDPVYAGVGVGLLVAGALGVLADALGERPRRRP